MEDVFKIEHSDVLATYNAAKKAGRGEMCTVLKKLFGRGIFRTEEVTKRIKTFEDACEELGDRHPYVEAWSSFMHNLRASVGNEHLKDIEAYLKLRIIVTALNEGWKPQFTDGEFRYFPHFRIYTKEELEKMGEEEVNHTTSHIFNKVGENGCVEYAFSNCTSSYSNASSGSRLALKSEELADYCGKQFIDLWKDYLC